MKTGKAQYIYILLMLMTFIGMISCRNFLDNDYGKAILMSALNQGQPGQIIDSKEEIITINGFVVDIGESSVSITGDDSKSYISECPGDIVDFIQTISFWKLIVKARVIDDSTDEASGPIKIEIINAQIDKDYSITRTGTVHYIPLEGGFWGIIGDDGKKYDMCNLPQEYAVENLRVSFTAKISNNCVAYHMWGVCVELTDIGPAD